jgi:hypothetical protein
MELKGSLLCSQELATSPYPETDECFNMSRYKFMSTLSDLNQETGYHEVFHDFPQFLQINVR